ncbi:RNA polymerase sigma factor [uncultured Croceitalea sp.]|uniref:RNA polymerase sigma factor n=1 Tax=uncultured Croceitalea sp. TaxID=1798908 RepID=UPI00374EBA6D
MDFSSEDFLARRLKSGDEKAYDFLMEIYYQKLCSYAYTLINDLGKSEDIVQDVMIKLWVAREKTNFKVSIKNYLYKSVYNEFINRFRKNEEIVFLERKYIEALDLVIEKDDSNLDLWMKHLDIEISNLPPKCKKVFILNKREGLTHLEISEYLNISVKTVEGHITRAFKLLNEKLNHKIKPLFFLIFGLGNNPGNNSVCIV